jgi:hypothetical protein
MAIYDYGVTPADVKQKAPVDTRLIGVGTEPVSDGDLTEWIEEAASDLTGVLSKSGIDGQAMSYRHYRETLRRNSRI